MLKSICKLTPVLTPVANQSECLFHRPNMTQWLWWCITWSGTVVWDQGSLFVMCKLSGQFITSWKRSLIFIKQLAELYHGIDQTRLLQLWVDRDLHGKMEVLENQRMRVQCGSSSSHNLWTVFRIKAFGKKPTILCGSLSPFIICNQFYLVAGPSLFMCVGLGHVQTMGTWPLQNLLFSSVETSCFTILPFYFMQPASCRKMLTWWCIHVGSSKSGVSTVYVGCLRWDKSKHRVQWQGVFFRQVREQVTL